MRYYQGLAIMLCAAAPFAQGKMPAGDVIQGVQDHPLLSRFEGAKLVGYGFKEYDTTTLPASKRGRASEGEDGFADVVRLEGRYTRLAYNFPNERSTLEVMRNYEAALQKAGMKTLFACAKEECGRNFGSYWHNRLSNNYIKGPYITPFNFGRDNVRYLLAKGTRPDGSVVHAAVYVVPPVGDKNGGIHLAIVEGKAMETGKVTASLNAADMAKRIAADGKVAIYGVLFDTDKADVKPDSKPALAEMAKLLQQDPRLKVFVVGHTDNQGTLAHNIDLSQRRAESVARVLAADYRIDPKRLAAKGVASYAPVASNDADPGRERNRRVELVKQ